MTYSYYTDNACTPGEVTVGSVTVTGGLVPDSLPIAFSTAGIYYWRADYSGDSNNAGTRGSCSSEQLMVLPARPSITTDLSPASSITVGGTAHDTASLISATPDAGGTVAYSYYTDGACTQHGVTVGSVTLTRGRVPDSLPVKFSSAGTYYWQAVYSGDSNNHDETSSCWTEVLVVDRDAPTISTDPSASSIQAGTSVSDSATLADASASAGGTVTYTFYTDNGCSQGAVSAGTVSVTGGVVPDSNSIAFHTEGTFYWQAVYSGDPNNMPATSRCQSEVRVVSPVGDQGAASTGSAPTLAPTSTGPAWQPRWPCFSAECC